jgi:hypothetical protein
MNNDMDKDEEKFNKAFQALKGVTPRTSLLDETLAKLPRRSSVTPKKSARFSYVAVTRYSIGIVFAALMIVFISPLLRSADVVDDIYAMEMEAEEISWMLEDEELSAEMDYANDEIDLVDEDLNNY